MTRTAVRIGVVVTWIAAEVWQAFFGALSSLQIAAPGVGERASWVPNLFVAEAATLVPVGFLLLLWGRPAARSLAMVVAVVMLAIAAYGATILGRASLDGLPFFILLAPPPLLLIFTTRRVRRAVPPFE